MPHANSVPTYDHQGESPRRVPPQNNNGHDIASNRNLHYQHFKQSLPQQQQYHSTPRNQHPQHQKQLYQTKSETRHSVERRNVPKSSSISGACAKSVPESRRQPRRRSLPVEAKSRTGAKDSDSTESATFLGETKGSHSLDTDGHGCVMNGMDKEGASRNRYLDDDDDSLESLILERKMSMRKRKEKRQRRKLLRSGNNTVIWMVQNG